MVTLDQLTTLHLMEKLQLVEEVIGTLFIQIKYLKEL